MKIAVTYENGEVFQHFGHTEQFKLYEVSGGKLLQEANIRLIGGVQGNADEAVQAFLNGTLAFDPNVHCTHHEHGEGHSCGSHGCSGHCHE